MGQECSIHEGLASVVEVEIVGRLGVDSICDTLNGQVNEFCTELTFGSSIGTEFEPGCNTLNQTAEALQVGNCVAGCDVYVVGLNGHILFQGACCEVGQEGACDVLHCAEPDSPILVLRVESAYLNGGFAFEDVVVTSECLNVVVVGIGEGSIHVAILGQECGAVLNGIVAIGAGFCKVFRRTERANHLLGHIEECLRGGLILNIGAQLNESRSHQCGCRSIPGGVFGYGSHKIPIGNTIFGHSGVVYEILTNLGCVVQACTLRVFIICIRRNR